MQIEIEKEINKLIREYPPEELYKTFCEKENPINIQRVLWGWNAWETVWRPLRIFSIEETFPKVLPGYAYYIVNDIIGTPPNQIHTERIENEALGALLRKQIEEFEETKNKTKEEMIKQINIKEEIKALIRKVTESYIILEINSNIFKIYYSKIKLENS